MKRAATYSICAGLLALAPAMAAADAFADCSTNPVGQGACTAERLGEALSLLSPGAFRPFHDAGMESFAMAHVMGLLSDGVAMRLAGGSCEENLELEYSVSDIWFFYVSLPDDAPATLRQEFQRFEALRDNALEFALQGDCA